MRKRNPNATCGTCPYWQSTEDDIGECRKNTPTVYTFESGDIEFHLRTRTMHWCGQHPEFWDSQSGDVCETTSAPTWKCECCGGTFPTPITGNDLIDADLAKVTMCSTCCSYTLAKATIDDLYTEIAQRDAVIAQCAAALDALRKEDVRGKDLITLETWSALMHARDATRAITPAPLYLYARELPDAAKGETK